MIESTKDVDPRQPGISRAHENPPVEYKVFQAQNGFSPGLGWEYVGAQREEGYTSYSRESYYENNTTKYHVTPMWIPGNQWLIFRRRRDTLVEELRAQLDDASLKERKAHQKVFDVEKAHKETCVLFDAAQKMIIKRDDDVLANNTAYAVQQERCKKMEVDIQKLRAALGELRMSEILG